MIKITKIFRFEMAHAIFGYAGKCKNIHGHSYILHVTISGEGDTDHFFAAPGFIFDFKELKKIVNEKVITQLDHRLVLSKQFLQSNTAFQSAENLFPWEMEPSAENILLFIKKNLKESLPSNIILARLKLFETADSYAEWED